MSSTPFVCDKCGQPRDYKDHSFVCPKCGYKTTMEPVETKCFSCGKEYTKWTWFDPSSCQHCRKSFVD